MKLWDYYNILVILLISVGSSLVRVGKTLCAIMVFTKIRKGVGGIVSEIYY